jgi:hypothetical protein
VNLREIAIAFAFILLCLVAPPIALIHFPFAALASILAQILPPSAIAKIRAGLRRIWGDVEGAIYEPNPAPEQETAATTIKEGLYVLGAPVIVEGVAKGLNKYFADHPLLQDFRQITVSAWYFLALLILWYLVQRTRPAKERYSVIFNGPPPGPNPVYWYPATERLCLRCGLILTLFIVGVFIEGRFNETLADRIFSWAKSDQLTEFQPTLRVLPDQLSGKTVWSCWAFEFDPMQFREPATIEEKLRDAPDAMKYKLGGMDAQVDNRLLAGVTYLFGPDESTQRRLAFTEKSAQTKCTIIVRIALRNSNEKRLSEAKIDPRKLVIFRESPRRQDVGAHERQ